MKTADKINRFIQSNYIDARESDYLYIKHSQIPNAGKGLFTAIDIFNDEIISLFEGEILNNKEAVKRVQQNRDEYFINLLDGRILDSKNTECFAKYANDAEGIVQKQI